MLFVSRLQEFRTSRPLSGAFLLACVQMTLTPIFVRGAVRGSTSSLVQTGKANKPDIDHVWITSRFQEFTDMSRNKPCQRQNSVLERQLSSFLASLSPPKCAPSCASGDIVKFLLSRDKSGRTQLQFILNRAHVLVVTAPRVWPPTRWTRFWENSGRF